MEKKIKELKSYTTEELIKEILSRQSNANRYEVKENKPYYILIPNETMPINSLGIGKSTIIEIVGDIK